MRELYRDDHCSVTYDEASRIVRYVRSTLGFDDPAAMRASFGAAARAAASVPRASLGLLLDLRAAPGRNDPAFEEAMRETRQELVTGFAHTAVVVATAAGRLQVERQRRNDQRDTGVFGDPDEAAAYLRAALARAPRA